MAHRNGFPKLEIIVLIFFFFFCFFFFPAWFQMCADFALKFLADIDKLSCGEIILTYVPRDTACLPFEVSVVCLLRIAHSCLLNSLGSKGCVFDLIHLKSQHRAQDCAREGQSRRFSFFTGNNF